VQENSPAWLKSPPESAFPSPPVNTRAQTLPFGELTWENFERLIRRVVIREATISDCWIYGVPGQNQYGLDILGTQQGIPGNFACYQCKRVKKYSASDIEIAVNTFLKGKWANKTKRFILCSTLALNDTKQVDEITVQTSHLATKGIEFEVWDGSDGGLLSERLKKYPDLVDDFFLREWVHRFNGSEAAELLGERLHGAQLAGLRSQLKEVYATLFLRHDQGLRLGSQCSVALLDRYVAPYVIETREIVTSEQGANVNIPKREKQYSSNEEIPRSPSLIRSSSIQETRTPIGKWLSQHDKTVILGEPGYGKSALLRVIALQLMNDRDDLFQLVWGELLPVWISFGGFSAAIQNQPNLSLEDYFDMWLHQNGADNARPLFRRAVKQGKMLLLVDGLDEGQDVNVAKQAMDRISTFLSIHATPAVFTSRPRGYKRVGPDGTWSIARLDSFDEDQIERFSRMWFEYLEVPETTIKNKEKRYLINASQRTSDFLKVVRANSRVMDLARTPLFCQLLIDIFRYSHHLPEQRIKVYEKIVEMLLSDHPAARIQAAGLTHNDAPRSEDMREMLMSLALHIEEKGGAGVISTVDCKTLFCDFLNDDVNGPGLSNYEAKHQALSIINHAQTGLGLIVERAPDELGFFHLTIQEYLAAQAMVRKDEEEQLAWLVRIWNKPKWHEVVLAWFSIRGIDQGKGATQRAIDCLKKTAITPWEQLELILLRTELAANDLGLSPREARSTIEEAADQVETSPYPEIRQSLARQITLGLRTPSIANICEARLSNWIPGRSEWSREQLLKVLGGWKSSNDLLHTLKLALHDESLSCRLAAAESLAKVFSYDPAIGDFLSVMAVNWPDTAVRASTMHALWKGWPDHEALPRLADNARSSMDMDLVLTCITIRVSKGLRHEDDRKNIWFMFVNENVSYELSDKCLEILVQGWGKHDEFKRLAIDGLKNPYRTAPMDKKQFVSFLAYAWPGDTEVASSIAHYFRFSTPFFIHDDRVWNALFTGFRGNADLSKVLREALSERLSKYQSISWGPNTKQLYCTIGDEAAKSELLEAYATTTDSQKKFWICSTLMEAWNNDSEVNELLTKEFLKPPKEVAYLGDWVGLFITEQEERRNWLLEAIKNPEPGLAISAPVRQLLHEFKDEKCLTAVKIVLEKDIWYYHKVSFQSRLIEIYPNDEDVREWVEIALDDSDGPSIASIAISHEDDKTIRSRLLAAARPAKANVRAEVFRVLRENPIPANTAQKLTAAIWAEGNGAIRTAGVLARCIVAQKLTELRAPLVEKLNKELNSSGARYEDRRRSSFVGLLQLGEYETCIDVLAKESPSSHYWLGQYHNADSLTARALFEHWDKLDNTSQTLGRLFELPWGGLIYNGTAREALVNDTTRIQLVDYLKTIPIKDRSPESLSLMAELLPGLSELSAYLIETIKGPSYNALEWESQRIYAEQFGGDEHALSELKNIWSTPAKVSDVAQPLPPYLYALVMGWTDNQELRSLMQQGTRPKLPIPIVLAMSAITGNEKDVSACIDKMIEVSLQQGHALPNAYMHGLRKWGASLNAEKLLRHLMVDSNCSRMITAISLLFSAGKLSDTDRLELITNFNEMLCDVTKHSPDGIDLTDGKVKTLEQVLVRAFLIGED
jgi:hypothetical protein